MFPDGPRPGTFLSPLPLSFGKTRINCINVLINQAWTLWERGTKTVAKDDGVVPASSSLKGGWNVDWNEASLVSVFILLSSIFRREINVALLEKLKENRRGSLLLAASRDSRKGMDVPGTWIWLAALRWLMKRKHFWTVEKHFPRFRKCN